MEQQAIVELLGKSALFGSLAETDEARLPAACGACNSILTK